MFSKVDQCDLEGQIIYSQRAAKDLRPAVRLADSKGNQINLPGTDVPANYYMPSDAILTMEDLHGLEMEFLQS